ncbi:hypothetical protein [Psychrobacter aestuarii]|uniref:Uncharacterized protein n=1 Tax=Psychrobacter aestuarii TaxID=556327 RepID=A0ABN0VWP5_9GAMM|nr:hypothetical protein [Psychrobacter aestuarii]
MNESMKTVTLLKHTLPLNDLSIGQAIDIAKSYPESYNEARISALIGHVVQDSSIARSLTASERYCFLLHHQHATQGLDSANYFNIDDYLLPTVQADVPSRIGVTDSAYVQHLYGAHVEVLEQKCENAADWFNGQMICQLYGNISSIFGGDEQMEWKQIPPTASKEEINQAIEARLPTLDALSANGAYNDLTAVFANANTRLDHFISLGSGPDGLLVHELTDGNEQEDVSLTARRFLCLSAIDGIAGQLIETFRK